MSHASDEELLKYLDCSPRARGVMQHLAECLPCRARLEDMRSTSDFLLRAMTIVDAAEPARWAAQPVAMPMRPGMAVQRAPHMHAVRAVSPAWRWAAAVTLTLAGAAVSASMLTHRQDVHSLQAPAEATAVHHTPPDAGTVIIMPRSGWVTVTLHGAGPVPQVEAVLDARPEVRVTVLGSARPRFEARDGEVSVWLAESSSHVRVQVPRTLEHGSVHADGRELIRITNGTIMTPQSGTSAADVPRPLR